MNPAVAKHYGKKIPPVAQRIETASSEFQSYMSSRVNNSPQNHGHYYYNTRTFGTPSKKSNFHQQHNEFMNEEEEDPFPPPPLQSTEPPHETREESDEESQSESAHDSADAIVAQLLAGSSIPQRLPSSNFSGVQTSSKSVIATTEAEISTSGKGSVVSTNSVSVLSAQPEFSDINSLLTMLYDGSSSRRGSVMKHPSDDFSNKKKAVGKTIDGMILAEEDDVEIREGGADEDEEVIQERQYKLLTTVEHKLNMLEPNRVNSAFGAATFSAGRKTTGFGNMPLRPLVKRSSASFSAKKRKTAQWKRMARVLKDTVSS